MSRKKTQPKKNVVPDPKFNSTIIPKLINNIMYDGKRGVAAKIVYDAIDKIKTKSKDEEVIAKRKIQAEMDEREKQKEEREKEISDKIRELDSVQEELDQLHENMEKESGNTFIILIALGAIVFFLIISLIFVLLKP